MVGKSKKRGSKFNPQEAGKLIYKVLNGCKRIPTEDYGKLVNTVLSAQEVRNNITKDYITFENMEPYIIILQVVNFKLGNTRYQLQVETSLEDTFVSLFNLTRGTVANKNVYCNGMVYDCGDDCDVNDSPDNRVPKATSAMVRKLSNLILLHGDPTVKRAGKVRAEQDSGVRGAGSPVGRSSPRPYEITIAISDRYV